MSGRLIAGIDIGGTKTAAVLLSDTLTVLTTATEPTERSGSPRRVAEHVEMLVDRLLREARSTHESLGAVGVGLPGLITPDRKFRDSIILPTWHNVDFGSLLHPRLRVPVVIDNDTTMAALGHLASIPHDQRPSCLICLTLGTGVGGAVLLNGEPLRGLDGTAGQIGHLIVNPFGRPCECGNSGCLNAYASGTAITARYVELTANRGNPPPHKGDVAAATSFRQALISGDPTARRALSEATDALVVAISSIVNVLNPEVVVLGGGVANLGSTFIDPIQSKLIRRSFKAPAQRARVCQAAYGALSGAIGAAVTASSLSDPNPWKDSPIPRVAVEGYGS